MEKVLVDTGASVTVLPEDLLESVGAPPIQLRAYLELDDGRVVEARVYATMAISPP